MSKYYEISFFNFNFFVLDEFAGEPNIVIYDVIFSFTHILRLKEVMWPIVIYYIEELFIIFFKE